MDRDETGMIFNVETKQKKKLNNSSATPHTLRPRLLLPSARCESRRHTRPPDDDALMHFFLSLGCLVLVTLTKDLALPTSTRLHPSQWPTTLATSTTVLAAAEVGEHKLPMVDRGARGR